MTVTLQTLRGRRFLVVHSPAGGAHLAAFLRRLGEAGTPHRVVGDRVYVYGR